MRAGCKTYLSLGRLFCFFEEFLTLYMWLRYCTYFPKIIHKASVDRSVVWSFWKPCISSHGEAVIFLNWFFFFCCDAEPFSVFLFFLLCCSVSLHLCPSFFAVVGPAWHSLSRFGFFLFFHSPSLYFSFSVALSVFFCWGHISPSDGWNWHGYVF